MSAGFKVTAKGITELKSSLYGLVGELRTQAGDAATKKAAQYIARKARQNVPRRTGNLRKSIAVVKGKSKWKEHVYWIGHRTGLKWKHDGYYAHMVEFGTAPHDITTKGERDPETGRWKAMKLPSGFAVTVKHRGAKPRAYMRPAFDDNWERAITESGDHIKKLIDKGKWSGNRG